MRRRLAGISEAVGSTPGAAAAWNVAAGHAAEGRRDDAAFYSAAAAYLVCGAHPELGIRPEDLTALLLGIIVDGYVVMPPADGLN